MAMLKSIGIGVLLTLFIIAFAYGFVLVIRNIIDCMPDPNDEED
jgi:UPF0716 family protein affecting phage T7 exclusion